MQLLNKKNVKDESPISYEQVSQIPLADKDIYVSTRRTVDLLKKIAAEPNVFRAIDVIVDETPDGRQALNIFTRLANQGINIEIYNKNTNRRVKRYDQEVRDFCSRIGKNQASGLDGLLDQLHSCSVTHGGMACEVVVNKEATDVDDVLLVDPATFVEYKYIDAERRYAIYQQRSDGRKVDLYEGNFFFVPHQPKAGRPEGTLQFLPAIPTLTQFYQLFADSMRILNRIGYPRYDVEIDQEAVLNSMTAEQKNTPKKQAEAFQSVFNDVRSKMRVMGKDTDIVHFSSNKVNILGGGVNGSGIDVRAWFEVLEPLIVNSFSLTPVLLGRLTSGSYSLGTVEFKIVTDTVDSMRRGSKRIVEDIINMWARVHGYPVYAVCVHNPINWEVEKEKLQVQLAQMEKARRAEEYNWIDHDSAAMEGIGAEKGAENENKGKFAYLSHDFSEKESGKVIVTEDGNNTTENKISKRRKSK